MAPDESTKTERKGCIGGVESAFQEGSVLPKGAPSLSHLRDYTYDAGLVSKAQPELPMDRYDVCLTLWLVLD